MLHPPCGVHVAKQSRQRESRGRCSISPIMVLCLVQQAAAQLLCILHQRYEVLKVDFVGIWELLTARFPVTDAQYPLLKRLLNLFEAVYSQQLAMLIVNQHCLCFLDMRELRAPCTHHVNFLVQQFRCALACSKCFLYHALRCCQGRLDMFFPLGKIFQNLKKVPHGARSLRPIPLWVSFKMSDNACALSTPSSKERSTAV